MEPLGRNRNLLGIFGTFGRLFFFFFRRFIISFVAFEGKRKQRAWARTSKYSEYWKLAAFSGGGLLIFNF